MATRIINGMPVQVPSFEFGSEQSGEVREPGPLDIILEEARLSGASRYDCLRSAFKDISDVHDLTGRYSSEEVLGFLGEVLGSPADFRGELSEMSDDEFAAKFDEPVVAMLVQTYSTLGEGAAD